MSAAYVTGFLSLQKHNSVEGALQFLKSVSTYDDIKKRKTYSMFVSEKVPIELYKNVGVFPYNKETSSLINFHRFQPYNLYLFSSKFDLGMHKRVKSLFDNSSFLVNNIDDFFSGLDSAFENLDLFVIGHTNELEEYTNVSYKKQILSYCLKKGIDIFTADLFGLDNYPISFQEKRVKLYSPYYNKKREWDGGKLYLYNTPIVGIFGTSSRQGKFSLQLQLKHFLNAEGYDVGHFSTEPLALLLGADETYPIGYNSHSEESEFEAILSINNLMHNIDTLNRDIIIVGSQSGTVYDSVYTLGQASTKQYTLLTASMPDCVVLCVNPDDHIELIRRHISVIESVGQTRVIALCVFPYIYKNGWRYISSKPELLPTEECNDFCYLCEKTFSLPTWALNDEKCIPSLTKLLIDFFGD